MARVEWSCGPEPDDQKTRLRLLFALALHEVNCAVDASTRSLATARLLGVRAAYRVLFDEEPQDSMDRGEIERLGTEN